MTDRCTALAVLMYGQHVRNGCYPQAEPFLTGTVVEASVLSRRRTRHRAFSADDLALGHRRTEAEVIRFCHKAEDRSTVVLSQNHRRTTADGQSQYALHREESDVRHFCQNGTDRSTVFLSLGEPGSAKADFVRDERIEVRSSVRMPRVSSTVILAKCGGAMYGDFVNQRPRRPARLHWATPRAG